MRAVAGLAVASWLAAASAHAAPPTEYACPPGVKPDRIRERCDCPRGQVSARSPRDEAICVAAPAPARTRRPPELVSPADGAVGVDAATEFAVEVPAWAHGVEIEICAQPDCRDSRLRIDTPDTLGRATIRIPGLPGAQTLYWHARGRKDGNAYEPRSETRSFTTAAPGSAALELAQIDALIAAGRLADVVAQARRTTKPAALLEVAFRLSKAARCVEALEVLALPREPDLAQEPQLVQLELGCAAGVANAEARRLVGGGDVAGAEARLNRFHDKYGKQPKALGYVAWSRAYVDAKRASPSCESARAWASIAETQGFENQAIAAEVSAICPPPPPPPPRRTHGGLYASMLYLVPISGAYAPEGAGLALGGFGHVDPNVRMGGHLVAIRPFVEGVDGRVGGLYGGEFRAQAGMREPARFSVRAEFGGTLGTGRFDDAAGRHRLFVFDTLFGVVLKARVAGGLRVALRGGMRFGGFFDFRDLIDAGLDGLGDRFHGTIGLDTGISLDYVFSVRAR